MDIQTENSFDFLGAEYASVFESAHATAFQSPVWLSCFYDTLVAARGAKPHLITFRDGDRLVGLVPLIKRTKKFLTLLETTDLGVSDYAAPVLLPELVNALSTNPDLQKQFHTALGKYDALRIRPVREGHCTLWKALFPTDPVKLDFSAHAVALEAPFDEWRTQNLDRKLAGMVARKGKRWKKQHDVVLENIVDPTEAAAAIAELAKLRAGRFEGDPIQESTVCSFYETVTSKGVANKSAEIWRVKSDGQTAAIVFGLTHNGRFLYLLIGADYDTAGRHSPGLQMYDWIVEDWMSRGGTSFDFTIGDEPFKMQFGTQAEPMYAFVKGNSLPGRVALKYLTR